jgi:DNA invertase Pin-like site-specific DNA recombinase
MKVLGYIRVSTNDQETDRQASAIRDYCERKDLELLDILGEPEGASGRATALRRTPANALRYYAMLIEGDLELFERTGYAALMKRVREEDVDAVVFYALDRFSRDALELLLLERILSSQDCALVSISDGGDIDTRTAAGKFMFRTRAVAAQFEVDLVGERTAAALAHKRENGVRIGRPPKGWKKSGNAFVHDDTVWPLVETIHQMRAEGHIYATISEATGVPRSSIKSYIDAYTWEPPKTGGDE